MNRIRHFYGHLKVVSTKSGARWAYTCKIVKIHNQQYVKIIDGLLLLKGNFLILGGVLLQKGHF